MSSFSLFSTPQSQTQQQQQQTSLFQPQQQQQQQFQFPQQQQQQQQQQQLFLFTNDKTPASYSTKWADLHPDSQNVLFKIEERILEYRDESQRLDQCGRLFDSSVSSTTFELDASRILQELGGISTSMERQRVVLHELMAVAKDMLRNAEIAVRSFMMLQPRFLHQKTGTASNPTAPSQNPGAVGAPGGGGGQSAANSMVALVDFYSGIPKKPSPFMQQTVSRFEKYLGECRQWVEELEQLLSDSDQNSISYYSSVLQSLPKVLTNLHEFFVHVAAKVESIHQYIESMRTAYLADQRRRGDVCDPFLEADRREVARQEAAAKRVHPTLHLPAPQQETTQITGLFASSGSAGVSNALQTTGTPVSSSTGAGFSLFGMPASTPAASSGSLFSTPNTGSALFSSSGASPQSSLFPSSSPSLFGAPSSSAFGGGASTPAAGGSSIFSTPFGSGPALGSGSSLGANRSRPRSRTSRR